MTRISVRRPREWRAGGGNQGSAGPVSGKTFGTWNAGSCCADALRENVDDVGFVSALIGRLVKERAVDPARVYATGMSNGAQLSYRLACELADIPQGRRAPQPGRLGQRAAPRFLQPP